MNADFSRIHTLSCNEEALDSRHRFMLADLIDQRANRWRPRKEVSAPAVCPRPRPRPRPTLA